MKYVDFSECEFIDENMRFYTYNDFCDKRKIIKFMFEKLTNNGKKFYMWYVYANIHMNEMYKNFIWDYLNDYDLDGERLMYFNKIYKEKQNE